MNKRIRILICGILPPPLFGHSAMYKILMESSFIQAYETIFLNMHFWSYRKHKKVTLDKLMKMIKYFFQYVYLIIRHRPRYVLYNMSFDKMPLPKDVLFCTVGRFLGCRIVLHDMGQYIGELYASSNHVYRGLIRWLCRQTTASIVLGENAKLPYAGFMEVCRLFAVPGSVEDTVSFLSGAPRSKSDSTINILYFSFMTESKGVFTAFKSVPKVLEGNADACFTFAGPMQSKDVQKAFTDLKEKYGDRIEYLGYIEDVAKRTELYRRSDIFIFPTHRDVFGLVLLHAMAEGIPVVASIEGCIPEIIQENVNGLLIKKGDDDQLADAVLRLARDTSLRKTMGEANRQRYLSVYSPQRYGQRMVNVFEDIRKKLG